MPELVYPTGTAEVRFAADGTVAGFTTSARPHLSFLARAGDVSASSGGAAVSWGEPEIAADVDELEVSRDADLGVRATVRHTFAPSWTVRLRLLNLSDAPVRLDDVVLGWRAGAGILVTAVAAGAVAVVAGQPASGRGPVLVGELTGGVQPAVEPDGLHLGPVELAPGASRVAQWRWEVVATARQAGRTGSLLPTTWLDLSQVVSLTAGPDVAVVAPGLGVESADDVVELAAAEPGSYVVELRSARGTTRVALDWAPDLDDLVDQAAARALDGPRTAAGVPRLADAITGLLVQHALARQSLPEPRRADEALELLAADLAESEALGPAGLALFAHEAERTGENALLVRAESAALAASAPVPGLGLAATRACLSLIRSGRSPAAVTRRLATLAEHPPEPDDVEGCAAALELHLLVGRRDAPRLDDALLRLGAVLGAGLVGRRLPSLALPTLAHLASVLTLVPETADDELSAWWGIGAAELARRGAAEARSRIGHDLRKGGPHPEAYAALGRLVLGAPFR